MTLATTDRDPACDGKAALNTYLRYAGPARLHRAEPGASVRAWRCLANVAVARLTAGRAVSRPARLHAGASEAPVVRRRGDAERAVARIEKIGAAITPESLRAFAAEERW